MAEIVTLEGVKKSFRTPEGETHTVLDIPRLGIPRAAQWVITGESGSGKTTFLNLIAGIMLPDEGKVHVAGKEITAMGEAARDRFRASTVGIVFQTFNLLQGFSALENILLGMLFAGKVDADRAKSLLERLGLQDRMQYKPHELSVGQQQRVAIARALANKPQLILADEPTGNLDPKTGKAIINLLKEMCSEGEHTLLIVTHQPQVVESFEDVFDVTKLAEKKA